MRAVLQLFISVGILGALIAGLPYAYSISSVRFMGSSMAWWRITLMPAVVSALVQVNHLLSAGAQAPACRANGCVHEGRWCCLLGSRRLGILGQQNKWITQSLCWMETLLHPHDQHLKPLKGASLATRDKQNCKGSKKRTSW